ncbi:murein biosynthesis integral membrane protein MurJ [Actinopolymorpha pittospori]|uniref:Peptidoglycan lipid II flippase n=1 Tax=Actinopolymorpha pittospori TaxID=648752 RepID=A0A927MZ24_9ACTN|nr:lipid II flippase MurJ [Actinopolymorpha pittospori]MBE1609591.1 putative peptidoglycan lipid II flippase [Actinopolymorpha pittospori]
MTTTREPRQAGPRAWGAGLARAAVLVAAITVAARVVGFGRWLVFSKTVGDTCLGDAYNTANQLPNVTFEIVAGGALASVVVPVLAGALAQPDGAGRADAERTLSALLSWTLLLLTPVALLAAVLAGPYAEFMLAGHPGCSDSTGALATRMLVVFAPQVWFYGIAVVLSGALQAQRRFVAAAAAPLASSVVVVAAYAGFGLLADGRLGAAEVPGAAIGLLAGGTTLGVVALAVTVSVPFARTRPRVRPTLRFPAGVGRRVRALAAAGMVALVTQQLVALLLTWLANHRGDSGTLTLYTWAYALFTLPYAVLAVPVATTVFPHVSALAGDQGARPAPSADVDAVASVATRAVLLLGALGGALLAGTATPVARLFVLGPGSGATSSLADALVTFAPAVPALGVVTLASRLLYARGHAAWSALGTATGWLAVAAAAVLLTARLSADATTAALGAATSVGLAVGATVLVVGVRRRTGRAAMRGLPRGLLAGSLAGVVSAAVGDVVGRGFATVGFAAAVLGAVVTAVTVVVVFGALVALVDRRSAALVVRRVVRRPVGDAE